MIRYEEPLFRPPSEADALILQVTIGCSWNRCTFCGMYRGKRFRIRPLDELRAEIAGAREHLGADGVRKVFLADGDALIAKAAHLEAVLDALAEAFPRLRRVSVYASPQALEVRTVEEMRRLRDKGLTLYYLGVESGDDATLAALDKGVDGNAMISCARKAGEAGVKLSTMILLGAAGRARSLEHARASARVINAIAPRFVSTLVMTPVPGTPLREADDRGEVDHLDPVELAAELREFVARLDLDGAVFRSNHASNHLALSGTLPKDREALVAALDAVLERPEAAPFRPNWMRGL
jgi:radical SAM superfamily enzyme YgiQ (UPF0313 family)